jgi:hypothetical protein
MARGSFARVTAVLLLVLCAGLPVASVAGDDADLAKGVAEVEGGAFGPAIQTLSGVVARLGPDPARKDDAARAFLHLGIAYAALGEVSPARSQFIQALKRNPGLAPDPRRYTGKILDVFAGARQEARTMGILPEEKAKKGGGLWKVALGAAVVGGGAAALAAGGSNGSSPATLPPSTLPSQFVLTGTAGSGTVRLLSSDPASGSHVSASAPALRFTFEVANTGTDAFYPRVQLVLQFKTAAGDICMFGTSDPIPFGPGAGGTYVVDHFQAVCAAPFTTTYMTVALSDLRFALRPYTSGYNGGYVVEP